MDNSGKVSEAQLDRAIPGFYARVRDDALIGPVSDSAIGDWQQHLGKLVDFWSTIMLTSGRYKGSPVATHLKHLPTITPPMFDRWRMLWTEVTAGILPPTTAAALQGKAARISESLKLARLPPVPGTPLRPTSRQS